MAAPALSQTSVCVAGWNRGGAVGLAMLPLPVMAGRMPAGAFHEHRSSAVPYVLHI